MSRLERLNEFMSSGWADNIVPKVIDPVLWPSMIALTEGADYHRPFGFSVPQYFPYDEKWAFFYCPEIMEEAVRGLSQPDFEDWLRYVRAHVSTHTRLDNPDEDIVEAMVFTVLPEAKELVGRAMNVYFLV